MKIERVKESDAEELLAIYAPYVKNTAISFEVEVPTLEEFRQRILQISAKYPYLKAVENGAILGYAYAGCFKARAAYDWSVETTVYVKESQRRLGVGGALYDQLEISLREMGILNMNACIASPSAKSRYLTDDSFFFHERMGFSLVGRFHDSGYKFGEWFDMIWMEKMIGDHGAAPNPVRFGEGQRGSK